jgi:hypothetical protein
MSSTLSVWSQDKWRGQFTVKWIYVKIVPSAALCFTFGWKTTRTSPLQIHAIPKRFPLKRGRQVMTKLHLESPVLKNITIFQLGVEDPSFVPPRNVHFRFLTILATTRNVKHRKISEKQQRCVPIWRSQQWQRLRKRNGPAPTRTGTTATNAPRLLGGFFFVKCGFVVKV